MIHRVPFGQGDHTLRFAPQDNTGRVRVTTATFAVENLQQPVSSSSRSVSTGTASVDAVSTTIVVDAGPATANPRTITVASVVGISPGRTYLLGTEAVSVESVAGTTLTLRSELADDHAAATAFVGVELSLVFPEATADDALLLERGTTYAVTWTYELDGETYVVRQVARVERFDAPKTYVTTAEFFGHFPELARRTRNKDTYGRGVEFASREIRARIRVAGKDPAAYQSDVLSLCCMYRAAYWHYRWLDETDEAAEYKDQYEALMRDQLAGSPPESTVEMKRYTDKAPIIAASGALKVRES